MRVIIKKPGEAPAIADIGTDYRDLQKAIGGDFETAIKDGSVHVYCDEDGIRKQLPLNLVRPSDGSPVVGTVVATGTRHTIDGPDVGPLDERQAALWLATLSLIGVGDWRPAALSEHEPRIHDGDRAMFAQLKERVARLESHIVSGPATR